MAEQTLQQEADVKAGDPLTFENQTDEQASQGEPVPPSPGHETEAAIEKEKREQAADDSDLRLDQEDLESFFLKQFGLDRQAGRKQRAKDKAKAKEERGGPEQAEAAARQQETASSSPSAEPRQQETAVQKEVSRSDQPPGDQPQAAPSAREVEEDDMEERLANIVAKAAAKLSDQTPKQEPTAEPAPSPEADFVSKLDESEQRRIRVLKKLEELYPKKYSKLSERYVKSLMEAEQLATKWETENPGQVWRDEDHEEELQEIAARHGINWDDEEYNEALVELKAEERIEKLSEQIEKRLLEKQRREAELQKAAVEAASVADNVVQEALEEISSALSDFNVDLRFYTEDGRLDKEKLTRLAEEDPIAYRTIISTIANGLAPATMEVVQIWRGVKQYDPNNSVHRWLDDFIISKEKEIAQLPKEKRLFDGKDFVPLEKYYTMPQEQRDKYWTLREEDILLMLRHHFAQEAEQAYKKELETVQRWFEKRSGKTVTAPSKTATKPPGTKTATEPHFSSPTTVSVPRGASKKATTQAGSLDVPEEFLRTLLGE